MPRRAWTAKDERDYEHIKDSGLEDGARLALAKEIAARTVNKRRREEGRTEHQRTQGTGTPNTSLGERKRDELYNTAKDLEIAGRGSMTKALVTSDPVEARLVPLRRI